MGAMLDECAYEVLHEVFEPWVLPSIHRLVCEGAVIGNRPSDSSASCDWCLPCAEYAHVHGRYVVAMQTHAAHVQPLVARLALHHGLPIVDAVAYASCAFAREAASVGRWGSETVGVGRCVEAIGEWVIVAVAMGCCSVGHVSRRLGPALVVCFKGVLRCTICRD